MRWRSEQKRHGCNPPSVSGRWQFEPIIASSGGKHILESLESLIGQKGLAKVVHTLSSDVVAADTARTHGLVIIRTIGAYPISCPRQSTLTICETNTYVLQALQRVVDLEGIGKMASAHWADPFTFKWAVHETTKV
jgi:hypothetical protein